MLQSMLQNAMQAMLQEDMQQNMMQGMLQDITANLDRHILSSDVYCEVVIVVITQYNYLAADALHQSVVRIQGLLN